MSIKPKRKLTEIICNSKIIQKTKYMNHVYINNFTQPFLSKQNNAAIISLKPMLFFYTHRIKSESKNVKEFLKRKMDLYVSFLELCLNTENFYLSLVCCFCYSLISLIQPITPNTYLLSFYVDHGSLIFIQLFKFLICLFICF